MIYKNHLTNLLIIFVMLFTDDISNCNVKVLIQYMNSMTLSLDLIIIEYINFTYSSVIIHVSHHDHWEYMFCYYSLIVLSHSSMYRKIFQGRQGLEPGSRIYGSNVISKYKKSFPTDLSNCLLHYLIKTN